MCVVYLLDYSELYIAIWRALSEINEEAIPLVYACIPRAMYNVTRPDFLLMLHLKLDQSHKTHLLKCCSLIAF